MFVNSKKIAKIIEEIAPLKLAESWDNVGFQVGNENLEIDRILVALEVTPEVIDEAIHENVDLIVTHHPLIFSPIKKLTSGEPISEMIIKMIQNNIHLYVAHTNLDASKKGTNVLLGDLLNLKRRGPLDEISFKQFYKLSVFVPKTDKEMLLEALFSSGAGKLGQYDCASYSSKGEGTFRPLEGANPTLGKTGAVETVEEVKLEVILPKHLREQVIEAMLDKHPYETVAYDLIALENFESKYSLGLTGYLEKGLTLDELSDEVKKCLKIDQLKVVRGHERKIRKIGICSGAGGDYITLASKLGCKCLITGDVKYHEAQQAKQLGLSLIDAGHFETENVYMDYLKEYIKEKCLEKDYDIEVITSQSIENPFEFK